MSAVAPAPLLPTYARLGVTFVEGHGATLTDSEGSNFATVEERLAAYGRMRERARHAFRHFLDLLPKGRAGIRLMGGKIYKRYRVYEAALV